MNNGSKLILGQSIGPYNHCYTDWSILSVLLSPVWFLHAKTFLRRILSLLATKFLMPPKNLPTVCFAQVGYGGFSDDELPDFIYWRYFCHWKFSSWETNKQSKDELYYKNQIHFVNPQNNGIWWIDWSPQLNPAPIIPLICKYPNLTSCHEINGPQGAQRLAFSQNNFGNGRALCHPRT